MRAYERSYEALGQHARVDMSRSDRWLSRNVAAILYEMADNHQHPQENTQPGGTPQTTK
jgi:hypothetical protein